MSHPAQLPLDLERSPAHGSDDFLVAACNAEAVQWLQRTEWPARALVLYGPAASGKTHLAEVWRARHDGLRLTVDDLRIDVLSDRLGSAQAVMFEEAQAVAGVAAHERGLLHLYNLLAGLRGRLLLTARQPPSAWGVVLPDLRSRLLASAVVEIGLPDDGLLSSLLVKLFNDRQLSVGVGVIEYLVGRIERSFDGARRVVAALDAASLSQRRAVSVSLARKILEQSEREE